MKLKRFLPLVLSVFLLTGCKQVYADALPEIIDAEEWGEIYEIKLKSNSKDATGEKEETLKESAVLTLYEDGASYIVDQIVNDENLKTERHIYKTSDSAHIIEITGDEREEKVPFSYDYERGQFDFAALILYLPFDVAYSLAKDLVDEDAISDIIAEVPDIESIKLTKFGNTFKLDVKGVNEVKKGVVYDTHVIMEFNAKGGIPRFLKSKTTMKDGKKVVAESDEEVTYSYREALPKYSGPKVK